MVSSSSRRRSGVEFIPAEFLCAVAVGTFFEREIVEQLTGVGILATSRGFFVKSTSFHFHGSGLGSYLVERQGLKLPDWPPIHEAFDVLAADVRNVVSETLLEKFDETPAVAGLFLPHTCKNFRGGGIVLAKTLGEVGIDTFIFFFQCDCHRENFTFSQAFEGTHVLILMRKRGARCEKPSAFPW